MAILIKLLRAPSLDELEQIVNKFFAVEAEDVRIEASLAGGITFANGEYVAPVRLSAPHKRKFQTVAEEKAAKAEAAEAGAAAQAEAKKKSDELIAAGNVNAAGAAEAENANTGE